MKSESSEGSQFVLWLKALSRGENHNAILGSLKRRFLKRPFLEMQTFLDSSERYQKHPSVLQYSTNFEASCVELLNSVGSLDYWTEGRFRGELLGSVENPNQDIYLIVDGDRVSGFMALHTRLGDERSLPEIGYVAVAPWARGRKLGNRLLQHILRDAYERGYKKVFLKTDSFRIPAIKTYLRSGFVPAPKTAKDTERWNRLLKQIQKSE